MSGRVTCAVLGSGNIGTDLMYKLLRSTVLDLVLVAGVDPASDGLARAKARGIAVTADGVEGILAARPAVVFDATSAKAHEAHASRLREAGIFAVDLTPAAVGPYVIPTVNLNAHLDAPNVNLITCGGQATIPIVAAIARVTRVPYAEIVATIASKSAGPGTRHNIDEFTVTTARGVETLGGAEVGRAIIVLNPAEPPMVMRDTVHARVADTSRAPAIVRSIEAMVAEVASYVPGYRLKAAPLFDADRVTVLLEVEGAGDYLPTYSGNLDIMTATAVRVAEARARAL